MKKLIWLFLGCVAFAQTPVTVTGTIVDATNNLATSGYVQFDIQPQPSNVHFFVPGSLAIVLSTATCGINPSGQLKNNALSGPCQVWGNDSISPSNTCYNVTLAPNGVPTQSIPNELIGGSTYDLAAPQFCTVSSLVPQFSTITSANSQQNIIPGVNHVYTVGLNNFRYSQGWFDTIFISNALGVSSGGTGGVTVPTLNRFLKGTGSVWNTSNGAASGTGSCSTHFWVFGTNNDAAPTCTQPNFTDLLGSLDPTQDYNIGPGVVTNTKVTINARGRVTAMAQAASTDLSDSAGLERLANKDQTNGYPGLSGGLISGAELPAPQAGVLGGVKSSTAGAGQFATGVDTSGAVTYGTPTAPPSTLDKQDPAAGVAGNSADQTIYTYSMPSGTLAAGKCIRISMFTAETVGAGTPTFKIFFGATAVVSQAMGASGDTPIVAALVCNNTGSTTVQWGAGQAQSGNVGSGTLTRLYTTPAENTASGSPIVVKGTFNVANTTSIAGKGWLVEQVPQ